VEKTTGIEGWNNYKKYNLIDYFFAHTIGQDVLRRDNYTCQVCGQRGGKLQVDHIQHGLSM